MSCCGGNSGSGCCGSSSSESSEKPQGGCASSGGCAGCPRKSGCGRAPLGMVCIERPALLRVIEALKNQTDYTLYADDKEGLVLRAPDGTSAAAQLLDFAGPIDPLTGWTIEAATLSPFAGLAPHGTPVSRGAAAELYGALLVSRAHFPAFFAVMPPDASGNHALRPVPYPRLTRDEYAAALAPPASWPPASAGSGAMPSQVVGGFVLDPAADACEEVHARRFAISGRPVLAGDGLFAHVALGANLALPWVRMAGKVLSVGELPAEDAPAEPAIGASFFKECTCGRPHPREEVLRELGTVHGQRFTGVMYLTPEFVGRLPELAGQWDVTFVADDHKQFLWQLERMAPRPIDQWVARD